MLATALHGAFPRPKQEKLHSATLPHPGIEPRSPALKEDGFFFFLTATSPGKPRYWIYKRSVPSAPDALGVESTLKAIGLLRG